MLSGLITSIQQFQSKEKELQSSFATQTPEERLSTLSQMNELTQLRVNLFNELKTHYTLDKQDNTADLHDQTSTLFIVENELNKSQNQLRKLNEQQIYKIRKVENSRYLSEKYGAYTNLLKTVIIWLLPIGFLLLVKKYNPVPERMVSKDNSGTVFIVLILGVVFVASYKILTILYDLSLRNNMNFNEYDFGDIDDSGVQQYDKRTSSSDSSDSSYTEKRFEQLAHELNLGCIDSSCCADRPIYHSFKEPCIPVPDKHKENTTNAALTKGVSNTSPTDVVKSVEGKSRDNVPFSSV